MVSIPRESWHDLEEVLLEEMTVFVVSLSRKRCSLHMACVVLRVLSTTYTVILFRNRDSVLLKLIIQPEVIVFLGKGMS